jgi:hypothetical protein
LFTGLVKDVVRIETRLGGDEEETEKLCKEAVCFKIP